MFPYSIIELKSIMSRVHGCREIHTELHKYLDGWMEINQSVDVEKTEAAGIDREYFIPTLLLT